MFQKETFLTHWMITYIISFIYRNIYSKNEMHLLQYSVSKCNNFCFSLLRKMHYLFNMICVLIYVLPNINHWRILTACFDPHILSPLKNIMPLIISLNLLLNYIFIQTSYLFKQRIKIAHKSI